MDAQPKSWEANTLYELADLFRDEPAGGKLTVLRDVLHTGPPDHAGAQVTSARVLGSATASGSPRFFSAMLN
jgi:hypothetical protein